MPENGNTVVTAFLASFLVLIDIYKKGLRYQAPVSQDNTISWTSSDEDEKFNENAIKANQKKQNDLSLSPVIHRMRKTGGETLGSLVKNAPSGSPILTQNRFSTVRKRPRRPSLLSISPITPDRSVSSFFADVSHFSISVHDETSIRKTDIDTTPLALPLVDSDDESNRSKSLIQASQFQSQADIESFCTQRAEDCYPLSQDFENPENSISDAPSSSQCTDEAASCDFSCERTDADRVTGSAWIETLMDKLGSESGHASALDATVTLSTVNYDSSKKVKFVKDGLAEQLQHVLRQQKTEKVLFEHQVKEARCSDKQAFQCCMQLKVLSHHREGALHVMECRVLRRGKQLQSSSDFFTLLLHHDVVTEHGLTLTSEFTIYPPWKTMELEEHVYPVLLCVDHIKVKEKSATETDGEESQNSDMNCVGRHVTCESLLEALERVHHGSEIAIAATVQRVYSNLCRNFRWTLLCEDAFGVFFEAEVESALAAEKKWQSLLKYAEGQRVFFQQLTPKGRTTRTRAPRLFSLIDSVWNNDGLGLMQVGNSQSLSDTQVSSSQKSFSPPSFAYLLLARHGRSVFIPPSDDSGDQEVSSHLNRPAADGSTRTDILYRPVSLTDDQGASANSSCFNLTRSSFACKVLHCHRRFVDADATSFLGDVDPCVSAFVIDERERISKADFPSCHEARRKLRPRNLVLLKDCYRQSDGRLILDSYSRVLLLARSGNVQDENAEVETPLPHAFPSYTPSTLSRLVDLTPPAFPPLRQDSVPDSFVTIKGDVQSKSRDRFASSRSADGAVADISRANEDEDERLQVILRTEAKLTVRVKLLKTTSWKLASRILPFQEIEYLSGATIGPLKCYLISAPCEAFVNFHAEEVSC